MDIHYLEVVCTEVDSVCRSYSQLFNAEFSDPVEALGNSKTASLSNGGRIGVRAPMHESETPAVRTYLLVDDVDVSIKTAVAAGAEIAHPPFELPGEGIFAIFSLGGVMHGLWQR